jgi:leucyl aminopeptidase (aminopeptidase T)
MVSLKRAINSILKDCFKARSKDSVIILADEPQHELAVQFFQEAKQISPDTSLVMLPEVKLAGKEPPVSIAELMKNGSVIVILTSRSLSHTQARRQACKNGARIASLPGITNDILCRTMNGQYREMIERSRKIADILTIGRNVKLTTPAGTSLSCSISRMRGYSDTGMLHHQGRFSNLPAGEGSVSPIPESTSGTLVIDGSFPVIGKIRHPIRITIKNGQAVRIMGEQEAEIMRKLFRPYGRPGKTIAELGIGTNPAATFTGCVLEDEKSLGTVHVAFGNNISFGGKNPVKCHYDGVLLSPTLIIDNKTILENGILQV